MQLYCTRQYECSAVLACSVLEIGQNYIVLWKFWKVCCPGVQIFPATKWRIPVHSWRNCSFSIRPGCELNIIIVKAKVKVKSEAGYGVGVLRNAVFVPGSESESPFWARLRLRARTTPWLYTEPSTTRFRPVYSSWALTVAHAKAGVVICVLKCWAFCRAHDLSTYEMCKCLYDCCTLVKMVRAYFNVVILVQHIATGQILSAALPLLTVPRLRTEIAKRSFLYMLHLLSATVYLQTSCVRQWL